MTGGGLKDADSYVIAKKAALAVAKMEGGRCEDICDVIKYQLMCMLLRNKLRNILNGGLVRITLLRSIM